VGVFFEVLSLSAALHKDLHLSTPSPASLGLRYKSYMRLELYGIIAIFFGVEVFFEFDPS
jgi:hypothetical protein